MTARSRTPRPWLMLAFGVAAQASSTVFVSTPAFLIPLLHTERGLSLAQAGLLASAPTLGLVLTLIAWGALSDRIGERWVIASGLALTALAGLGAMLVSSYLGLAASVVGPAVGALIGWVGYPFAFAIVALCPAVATPLVPRDRELEAVPA
jgi:MFS family permease